MGALKYIPEKTIKNETSGAIDLDELAQQARSIESDETVADVAKLFAANGGSAGARPKIVTGYNSETAHFQRNIETGVKPGFEPWIIKFRSIHDPLEIAREEYAYALMAKRAGVEMPKVQLLTSKNDAYFAVKRFDRTENNARRHVLTMSALLDVDHHAAGAVDYSTLMKLTLRLSSNAQHVDQMFRRMVFNVFAHNRDDHSKNHAFIMSEHGQWAPSPAYDITFSTGPGGQHNLDIAGEGLRPGPSHILAVAKQIGTIKETVAQQIIDEVRSAITEWPTIAKDAGLSSKRSREIAMVINPSAPRPRIKRGGKDPTD
jgi:serine/threonine-protein kinase HipA